LPNVDLGARPGGVVAPTVGASDVQRRHRMHELDLTGKRPKRSHILSNQDARGIGLSRRCSPGTGECL
jgi:hypothetical protein